MMRDDGMCPRMRALATGFFFSFDLLMCPFRSFPRKERAFVRSCCCSECFSYMKPLDPFREKFMPERGCLYAFMILDSERTLWALFGFFGPDAIKSRKLSVFCNILTPLGSVFRVRELGYLIARFALGGGKCTRAWGKPRAARGNTYVRPSPPTTKSCMHRGKRGWEPPPHAHAYETANTGTDKAYRGSVLKYSSTPWEVSNSLLRTGCTAERKAWDSRWITDPSMAMMGKWAIGGDDASPVKQRIGGALSGGPDVDVGSDDERAPSRPNTSASSGKLDISGEDDSGAISGACTSILCSGTHRESLFPVPNSRSSPHCSSITIDGWGICRYRSYTHVLSEITPPSPITRAYAPWTWIKCPLVREPRGSNRGWNVGLGGFSVRNQSASYPEIDSNGLAEGGGSIRGIPEKPCLTLVPPTKTEWSSLLKIVDPTAPEKPR
ncbi:hypothetical protein BJ322DRAFT_1216962 [Thelephora terrestris]|uniref:Uncharacterized protein n=1 Tax=Thelephora terrestris TaxID=56493 RepID=A0A9P6HM33_9AGAM|nr:hypothetical protein BJ322DRAFT_1216962 [Thelephora terrestris]